jgi:DNA helicase-2/ATP-dependent DNA helicase PcrA
MKEIRNIKRRIGRKISGRCTGTTLLTKGLEFDTVAVLDAHKFKCLENFYVE